MDKLRTVVVLGKFDGVHIAHAKLISTAVEIAKEKGLKSLVYSMQKTDSCVITDKNEKLRIIKVLGIDEVVFKELDEDFMALTDREFVEDVLSGELGAQEVVVGENFRFGKERMAGIRELISLCKEQDIAVTVIDTISVNDCTVSSTAIRNLLSLGEVAVAGQYLGRVFSVSGTVCEGKHLGRNLGFPTVNLYPSKDTVLPKNGVYATRVCHGGDVYPAITNVGINPTVEDGKNIKVETHVFSKTDNWYGDEITVEFMHFIRPEVHFDDMNKLKKQVDEDKIKAMKYHGI